MGICDGYPVQGSRTSHQMSQKVAQNLCNCTAARRQVLYILYQTAFRQSPMPQVEDLEAGGKPGPGMCYPSF